MKLGNIVYSESALTNLSKKHFSNFSVVYKLAMLLKATEEKTKFYLEQEKILAEKYSMKDEKGNIKTTSDGRLFFQSIELKNSFDSEIKKLQDTEIDDLNIVEIKESSFLSRDDYPTPEEVIKLSGVVEFVFDSATKA
jgi:hypothetical protein